jgi:hypothetical protein
MGVEKMHTTKDVDVFDQYTSLGRDCEVGFQFKRVLGFQESGFFNWNYTDPEPLLSLLSSDFAGILEANNLSVHADGALIHDASHHFFLHHEFDIHLFQNASDFSEKLIKTKNKFDYFIHEFKKAAHSNTRTAYFLKYEAPDARTFALKLQAELKRYHEENPFTVIVLQTIDRAEDDWGVAGIHNRYLKRFAPYDDTLDAHVPSWDNIFREFPHKSPLRLANY